MRSHKDIDMDYIAALVLPLVMQTPRSPARDRERAHKRGENDGNETTMMLLLPNKWWLRKLKQTAARALLTAS